VTVQTVLPPYLEAFDGFVPEIDPTVFVHRTAAVIGRVRIGADASIWPHVTLRGDEGEIEVGEATNIQDNSVVHMTGGQSHSRIGARITIGHACIIHGCIIEDDCLIGMGSTILDNAVIGRGSYIGAGTLIPGNKIIPPGSFVFGNPFKIHRPVNARDTAWIDYAWRHYREVAAKYRGVTPIPAGPRP
jgi:carbonic anhydrase/acetyltransferase-like protein (isoleucine patch superfamily)